MDDQITHLYYNLTRGSNCSWQLEQLLRFFKISHDCVPSYHFTLLYKLIFQTRDIKFGKGERHITYMMIHVWYKFYPVLAINALHMIMRSDDIWIQYGAWNDFKYFCQYIKDIDDAHPLIDCAIAIVNARLSDPYVAKWIPREHRKFDWLFERLVVHRFGGAANWQRRAYRKLIAKPASLNKTRSYKPKHLSIQYLVKTAFEFDATKTDWLNSQWNQLVQKTANVDYIPFIDMSLPLPEKYTAIGLGCLIAAKSFKRAMLVDQTPTWVNLDTDFVAMIQRIHSVQPLMQGGTVFNYKAAFDLMRSSNPPRLTYILLTDTDVDEKCVLWNMSNKWSEPDTQNILVSGTNPRILSHTFMPSSFDFVCKVLNHPRYNAIDHLLKQIIL